MARNSNAPQRRSRKTQGEGDDWKELRISPSGRVAARMRDGSRETFDSLRQFETGNFRERRPGKKKK